MRLKRRRRRREEEKGEEKEGDDEKRRKERRRRRWRRKRRRRKRWRRSRRRGKRRGGGKGGQRGGGRIPPEYLINFVRKASKICSKRRQCFFLFALLFLGYCSNKGMDLHLHPSKCISLCPNSVLVWDFDSEAMRLNICKS